MAIPMRAAVAAASEALAQPAQLIGGDGGTPRLDLFHAANSICSQKVRTVLAHKRIGYVSHQMNIFVGETYLPDHVRLRLRMLGCGELGLRLVSGHSGGTSVTGGGCDPAVVPTLIDWQSGQVMVGSKRICHFLDGLGDASDRLRPSGLEAQIDAELAVVDDLPNYQMQAHRRGSNGIDFVREKVRRCERYLAECQGDETLTMAYGAKRAKE